MRRCSRWIGRGWLRLLCCLCLPLQAAPLIAIDPNFERLDISAHVDLLQDATEGLSVESIAQPPHNRSFKPARPDELRRAPLTSTLWLRFGIANPGAETQTLALVLRRQEPGAVQLYAGDDWRELRAHPGAHFQLILPPHSRQLFYLRAVPGSLHAAQIELATIDHMLSALRDTRWFSGLYQGGLTALTLLAV